MALNLIILNIGFLVVLHPSCLSYISCGAHLVCLLLLSSLG